MIKKSQERIKTWYVENRIIADATRQARMSLMQKEVKIHGQRK